MSDVYCEHYRGIEAGDTITLPTERETDVERVGMPEIGVPDRVISVVGTGNTTPHVALKADAEGKTSVPDGSVILGSDPWTDTLWYAVPRSAYGGGGA